MTIFLDMSDVRKSAITNHNSNTDSASISAHTRSVLTALDDDLPRLWPTS